MMDRAFKGWNENWQLGVRQLTDMLDFFLRGPYDLRI